MKTYTEEQLKAAMEFACQHQKANSYQMAGEHLIVEPEDLNAGAIAVLDNLADTGDTDVHSIDMADVEEFMKDRRVLDVDETPFWINLAFAIVFYGIIISAAIGLAKLALYYKW